MTSPPGTPLKSTMVLGLVGVNCRKIGLLSRKTSLPPPPTSVSLPSPVLLSRSLPSPPSSRSCPRRSVDRVVAGQPAQHVVADVAVDDVRERVPGAVDRTAPCSVEVLDGRTQDVADRARDRIDLGRWTGFRLILSPTSSTKYSSPPLPPTMLSAPSPPSRKSSPSLPVSVSLPRSPSRSLAPALPVILLAERIADAGAIGRSGQRQVLDEIREGEGERRAVDLIRALVGVLDDRVLVAVDLVGVVAGAADRRVVAAPAVELVGAGIADEHVGAVVAGGVEGARAGQRDMLDAVIGHVVEVDGDRGLDAVVRRRRSR